MDVFGVASSPGAGGEFLRDAAIDAAHELGVFEALREPRTVHELPGNARRLRRLLDVLVALGHVRRDRDRFSVVRVPDRPVVTRAGWGLMADVIRNDKPLDVESVETEKRMHVHLAAVGAPAARELAQMIDDVLRHADDADEPARSVLRDADDADEPARSVLRDADDAGELGRPVRAGRALLDLGGGAGAYTEAWLDLRGDTRATLVDFPEVVGLARAHLVRFGERASFIASEIRAAQLGDGADGTDASGDDMGQRPVGAARGYDVALLANVLHLHGESMCEALVAAAAKAIAPGGLVVVKDLRMDEDRSGPLEGLLFALNMAIYTGGGDVYEGSRIRSWMSAAGLVEIEERRLEVSPDAIVVIGRKPAEDAIARRLDSELSRMGKVAWRELEASGRLRDGAQPTRLEYPAPLRRMLSRAIASTPAESENIERHYTEVMPRMRVTQIVGTDEPAATLMHAPLDWAKLPRMSRAIRNVFEVLAASRVEPELPLGAESAAALRARTRTFGELYMRTHYGACMPLLYGYPADLAYFMSRGFDLHATIDRYLTAPLVHELCHFGRHREALPMHLDECVGGYLGVLVWPAFAYPEGDHDDAIYAAPWLAQIGQAMAYAFGFEALVRGQTGAVPWASVLPRGFVAAAHRLAWDDWQSRRTLHLLSDTFDPRPWVAMALVAWAGQSLRDHTLESLAKIPLASLAGPARDLPLDLLVVHDALRAMCLYNEQVGGSFRTRTRVPETPIVIDAAAATVTTQDKSAVDPRAPSYWLPPPVAAHMAKTGIARYLLKLERIDAITDAAAAICGLSESREGAGYALVIA